MSTPETVQAKRALEALRNGVPNRDAVRVMGCNQPHVEQRFKSQLEACVQQAAEGTQAGGMLVQGGFGTGKSHLLEYLEHLSLAQNFVCSKVVISKETPLFDPAKVFQTAIDTAIVPNATGQAIQEIALKLDPRGGPHARLYQWAARADSGVSNLFAATLMLHERVNNDQELVEEITSFWAGQKLSIQRIRQGLRQIGAAGAFQIKAVPLKLLSPQRFIFASRLISAAGYRGWVILLDEVELIGRYSLLQRGKSYAELARLLGRVEGAPCPGLITVAAITDDFTLGVLDEKNDRRVIGERFREKGDDYAQLAPRAEAGMRIIERDAIELAPPDEQTLQSTYGRLKQIHAQAYGWSPPDVPSADRMVRRPMRSYVRRWISEWDLKRLYPASEPDLEEEVIRTTYEQDESLETFEPLGDDQETGPA